MKLLNEFIKQFKARDIELFNVDYRDANEFILSNDGIRFSLQIYIYKEELRISLLATCFLFKGREYSVDTFNINWEYDEVISEEDEIPTIINDIYASIKCCDIKNDFLEMVELFDSLKRDFSEEQLLMLEELLVKRTYLW